MSVVSRVVATPNRIRILYDYLDGSAGEERQRLIDLAGPKTLSKKTQGTPDAEAGASTLVDGSISEALLIGILEKDGSKVKARNLDRSRIRSRGIDEIYTSTVEWLLLNENSQTSQEPFGLALSWLLCHSPREPLAFSANQRNLLEIELESDDEFQLTNSANWQAFCYWARALGYCTFMSIGGKPMIYPDPTVALKRHLAILLPKIEGIAAFDLLSLMSAESPVFESGGLRRRVESQFRQSIRESNRFSQSTSLALFRLESAGLIQLRALADADTWTLDLGDQLRPVSHIARTREL